MLAGPLERGATLFSFCPYTELSHNVNEAILGVMSHMGSGESIKVVFAAAAATGKCRSRIMSF